MKNILRDKIAPILVFLILLLPALVALEANFAYAQNTPANTTSNTADCGNFQAAGPLCLPQNPFGNSNNSLVGQTTATGLIGIVIKILLTFSGILAVVFLIIGGYYYLTSRGNEEQATKGRQTLVYALLGLSIVILSYVIVTALTKQLTSNI